MYLVKINPFDWFLFNFTRFYLVNICLIYNLNCTAKYQKSFKNILNFNSLTMKFHNCHHTTVGIDGIITNRPYELVQQLVTKQRRPRHSLKLSVLYKEWYLQSIKFQEKQPWIKSEQKNPHTFKNWPIVINPQFLSTHHEV